MDQYLDTLDDGTSLVLEQYDALRAIWGDILQGFSCSTWRGKEVYVKHLGDVEHCKISKIQTDLTLRYLNMGVPSRQERLDFIIKESQEWNQDDEDEITSAEYFISDNQETYDKMSLPAQKEMLGEELTKQRNIVYEKKAEKDRKIGTVAETKAEKTANNYYVYYSLFRDEGLTKPFWDKEAFEELEDYELTSYVILYNKVLTPFRAKNFNKIAIMPFTLNLASYCKDNGEFFYGKPITQMTNYQLSVFTKVMKNTFILRETKTNGSPDINNELTMQALLDWYELEYNIIMAENQANRSAANSRR